MISGAVLVVDKMNVAVIVVLAVTFSSKYEVVAPTEVPSIKTSATWYPSSGVMVNNWLPPSLTVAVRGSILPLAPAIAVTV